MKIPWKDAKEGLPVPEEQYQERFWRQRLDGIGLDMIKKELLTIESNERGMREATIEINYVEKAIGEERRRSLYESRQRLRQVGEAYGEVRKPRCRRRYNWRFKGLETRECPSTYLHTNTKHTNTKHTTTRPMAGLSTAV